MANMEKFYNGLIIINLYSGHCRALLTIATHILGLRAKLHKESALEAMARRAARLSVYYLSILILHQPEKYESENNNKKVSKQAIKISHSHRKFQKKSRR